MIPADIICQNCGWRNEPSARMCGGCGKPLRESDPGATAFVGSTPASGGLLPPSGAAVMIAHDAPTLAGAPSSVDTAYPPPLQIPPSPLPQAPWPGVGAEKAKATKVAGSRPWWRIPLIAGIVVAVLVIGSISAWAFAIRPSVHSALDTQMRSVLDSGVYQAFSGSIAPGTYKISAKALNALVASQLPKDSPVSNVTVAFANNQVIITYAFWNGTGKVVSTIAVQNGRAVATGTSVDCPLCFVETGDEMESTFNSALSYIPTSVHVTGVQTINDELDVTVR